MPNQPRADNTAHTIRCDTTLWEAAKERARENGETVSDAVRRFLAEYTR